MFYFRINDGVKYLAIQALAANQSRSYSFFAESRQSQHNKGFSYFLDTFLAKIRLVFCVQKSTLFCDIFWNILHSSWSANSLYKKALCQLMTNNEGPTISKQQHLQIIVCNSQKIYHNLDMTEPGLKVQCHEIYQLKLPAKFDSIEGQTI